MSVVEDRLKERYPGSVYHPSALELFTEYGEGCINFVETGTAGSCGLSHAMKVGFDNYYSVDINETHFNNAMYIFEECDNVTLSVGDSWEALKVWLKEIDDKCIFWLDAHPDNPSEKTIPNQIITAELEEIKKHSFKEHTILVDDMAVYFDLDNCIYRKKNPR